MSWFGTRGFGTGGFGARKDRRGGTEAGRSAADGERGGTGAERAIPKPPRPVTAEYLRRAALYYLERYACSAAHLGRVLTRKVEKRAKARGEDASAFAPMVADTVEGIVRAGLVDDRAFATARAASLRRKGTSARGVAQRLAQKGVGRDLVAEVLAAPSPEADAPEDAERAAAHALARRKRLGPYRPGPPIADPAARAARRAKDLGTMARAGFAFDLARRVIDGLDAAD